MLRQQKKTLVALIICVIAIAALAVALVVLNRRPQRAAEREVVPQTEYVSVYSLAGAVSRIEVEGQSFSYTIVNNATAGNTQSDDYAGATVEGMDDLPLNRERLATALADAIELNAELISEDDDPARYGLADPRARVRVLTHGSASAEFFIGDANPAGLGVYLADADGRIFLISEYTLAVYLYSAAEDLISLQMTPYTTDYEQFLLHGTMREYPVIIEKKKGDADSYGSFEVVDPIVRDVDIYYGLPALQTLSGYRADEAVLLRPDEADLAAYGLDDPWSVAQVITGDAGSFVVSTSEPNEDGNVYLINESAAVIYRAHAHDLPWIDLEFEDLITSALASPRLSQLSQVIIDTPAASYPFQVEPATEGTSSATTVLHNGETIDTANFSRFFQTLAAAAHSGLSDQPEPAGAPMLTITYRFADAQQDDVTLRFYEGESRRALVRVNDEAWLFDMALSWPEGIVRDVALVASGESVEAWY